MKHINVPRALASGIPASNFESAKAFVGRECVPVDEWTSKLT